MCVCEKERERERERVIPVSLISIVLAFCILSIILHTFCNRLPSILVIDFLIFLLLILHKVSYRFILQIVLSDIFYFFSCYF